MAAITSSVAKRFEGLDADELIRAFRLMHTVAPHWTTARSRSSGRTASIFQISGAGHEAVQVAAGLALRPGYDWFYPYYRDRALCLTLGVTPQEMLLQAVGAAADPASGGRQMPSHWGIAIINIVSVSSPTGTQFLQAAGCAEASQLPRPRRGHAGDLRRRRHQRRRILGVAERRLPARSCRCCILVEDNGYAISVPVECQTAGRQHLARWWQDFRDLFRQEVDGTDFMASYRAMRDGRGALPGGAGARARARARASGRIRIRSPTTSGSTRRQPSARPRPSAIR